MRYSRSITALLVLLIAGMGLLQISTALAASFSNATTITLNNPGGGACPTNTNPIPSTIAVSGITGTVAKVTVTLKGFAHNYPDDMDILLKAPGATGPNIMLLSDAGGGNALASTNLTFDDSAAANAPNTTSLLSPSYKPTNYAGDTDCFNGITTISGNTSLDTTFGGLTGTAVNGTWSLYARDDNNSPGFNDQGSISGGWTINIWQNQTITFNPLANKTYGDADFNLTATATSELPVSYSVVSGPATITGNTVHLTGAGTVTIRASQAGNADYVAATQVEQSFTVAKRALTITADNQSRAYGEANPTLTATYAGFVNGDSAAVLDTLVSLSTTADSTSAPGNYPITASSAADGNYTITHVDGTLTVTQASQTITYTGPTTKTYGDAAFTLTASAPGGDVTFSYVSGPATLDGSTLTITGAGEVVVKASQAGNANYEAAPDLEQTITVAKANQTITYTGPTTKTYGDAAFTLTASAPGGDVTFSYVSGPATLDGSTLTITGAGEVVVKASQAGNANYEAAPDLEQTITVAKANQTITYTGPTTKTYGDAAFTLTASAPGGAVTFSYVSGPATLNGSTLTITGAGEVVVKASQAGDANYEAAPDLEQTITVAKRALTITADDQSRAYGEPNPTLTATYAGFVNGDSAAVLDTPVTLSTTADSTSAPGNYPITASGAADGNYTITHVDGTLTVTQASQTITYTGPTTKTYGDAPFTLTASAPGGDVTFSYISGPATLDGSTLTITGAGEVVVKASQAGNANYEAAPDLEQTITVAKANQMITFENPGPRTYGDAAFSLGATATSDLPVSYSVSDPTLASVDSTGKLSILGAGTVTVTASQDGNDNYNAALDVEQTFTVAKANQTITFPTISNKTFGNDPFDLTATADSGLPVSYTVSDPTLATIDSTGKLTILGAGTVTVTASQDGNDNYKPALDVSQTFTVAKASQTINFPTITDKTYGADPFNLGASATSSLDVSYVVVSGPASVDANGALAITGAGEVKIRASQAGNDNYNAADDVERTFTVNKATLTITADDKSKTYGDANPGLTASYSGFVNGDDAEDLTTLASLSTAAVASSDVGIYDITPSGAVSANYSFDYVAGTLTINKAELTITAENKTKKVNTANPTLTAIYSGFVNGDDETDLDTGATLSTDADLNSPVGDYVISVAGAADINYTISFVDGTLTVTNKDIPTISWADPASITYGTLLSATQLNASASFNGSPVPGTFSYTPAAGTLLNAGSGQVLEVSFTPDDTDTYASETKQVQIDVSKAALTITAQDKTKVYGQANPALTASYSGLVDGDSLDTALVLETAAGTGSSVGSYPITMLAGADPNYEINFNEGTLIITRAPLTITADSKTKVYGEDNPTLTASYSGFVNGDVAADLDTQVTLTTVAASSPVGSYDITASAAADANYSISYVKGTLSITKAALTITADDKTKVYGAANPVLTASYSGFVNGDDAADLDSQAVLSTVAASSSVGSYDISVAGAVDANYSISFVKGKLTINKAPLTITADNKTRKIGTANPTLTASYSGFVNGDTSASLDTQPSLSTTATVNSAAGSYPIVVTSAADANYDMSFVDGILTVTEKNIPTLIWNTPAAITYGTPLSASQLNATVGFNGNPVAGSFSYSLPLGTVLHAGNGQTMTVTFTPADPTSYAVVSKQVQIDVKKAALTIRADSKTKVAGTDNPVLTASYSGFVNGDTASVLDTAVILTTGATKSSPAGIYTITASGASDSDYSISYVNGSLTVIASGYVINLPLITR